MHRLLSVALLVALAVPLPAFAAEGSVAALPPWLAERLGAGADAIDARDVVVVRTVMEAGTTRTFEMPLASFAHDPLEGLALATPAIPEVLAGELDGHIMFQPDCAGYGAVWVAPGIAAIEDASWPTGVHFTRGPLAGGAAVGTGADPTNPANLAVLVNLDSGIDTAIGALSITETRLLFFDTCFVLVGEMSGTGAWVWS